MFQHVSSPKPFVSYSSTLPLPLLDFPTEFARIDKDRTGFHHGSRQSDELPVLGTACPSPPFRLPSVAISIKRHGSPMV